MQWSLCVVLVCAACGSPAPAPMPVVATLQPAATTPPPAAPAPPASVAAVDAGAPAASRDPVRSTEPLVLAGATVAGPCVDPVPWLTAHGNFGSSFYDDLPLDVDLDGDGTVDVDTFGGAARFETTHLLFVKRGDCSYAVGSVSASSELVSLGTTHHGLVDLRTSSDSCPLAERRRRKQTYLGYCETDWRFDGKGYVPFAERRTQVRPSGIRP